MWILYSGHIFEVASTMCGGDDKLDRALDAGRVIKTPGERGAPDLYYFPQIAVGRSESYERKESIEKKTKSTDAAMAKLSDFMASMKWKPIGLADEAYI